MDLNRVFLSMASALCIKLIVSVIKRPNPTYVLKILNISRYYG
jgi:hypothetical protein